MNNPIIRFIFREPALVGGLTTAVTALVISFGVQLSSDQVGAIMATETAIVAFFVRSQVSPIGH